MFLGRLVIFACRMVNKVGREAVIEQVNEMLTVAVFLSIDHLL